MLNFEQLSSRLRELGGQLSVKQQLSLVATFLGVFIIPGNFTFMQNLNFRFWAKKPKPLAAEIPEPVPAGDGGGH